MSPGSTIETVPVAGTAETLASSVFGQLKACIIAGKLRPGQKLRLRELAEQFGMGFSPLREALNRLSRDGLVVHAELRGFSVAPVSEEALDELLKTRCWLNELALRQSIARGDAAWEESVVVAYHRLSRNPRWISLTPPAVNGEWERAHRIFHGRLIESCGSGWLIGYCEQLFDAADRYRHIARQSPEAPGRAKEDMHRRIMEATVARDADKAVQLLNEHFTGTAEMCRGVLREGGWG
jgi:DNA-binding GntR family transcriptional regulator